MKYVYLVDGRTVHEIQPGKSTDFPGISIKDRFSAEYLANCVEVKDSVKVESGWLYDKESGIFSAPPVVEANPIPVDRPISQVTLELIPSSDAEALNLKIAEQESRISALEEENKSLQGRLKAIESSAKMTNESTITESEVVK